MKKFVLSAIILLAVCSCTGPKQEDPIRTAIKGAVEAQIGELKSFTWDRVEQIEESTFGEEIARRRNTIETRRNQNLKLAAGYRASGKMNNAAKKEGDAARDAKVLEGIDALEARLAAADSLNVKELTIYRFSARAKTTDGASSEIKDMYVAITPTGEVVAMDYKKDRVYVGTGKLIPGYLKVLGDE